MSIKPIDMQVLLPNIRKAASPENLKNARNEMAQQQNHIKEKKDNEIKNNKVSNLEQKDQNDIKNDKESSSKNKDSKKNKKSKKEDSEEVKSIDLNHGSRFDIKV